MRSRAFVVGLTLAALGAASAAHAQPAPQSDSPFRITAWAPKPLELPPYAGVHRPHWKLTELLAQHAGSASWSETLVDDRHQVAKYIQMAPGERTPRRLHPDTRTFWFVRDDRLMAVLIRGEGIARPPDTERGHLHIDYGELWLILEGFQSGVHVELVPTGAPRDGKETVR